MCVDPNSRTREEFYTPLHFAARYTPRIIDKDAQLQEFESTAVGNSVEVGKLSTSAQAMQYLVNLKKGKKVKASHLHHMYDWYSAESYLHLNKLKRVWGMLLNCAYHLLCKGFILGTVQ